MIEVPYRPASVTPSPKISTSQATGSSPGATSASVTTGTTSPAAEVDSIAHQAATSKSPNSESAPAVPTESPAVVSAESPAVKSAESPTQSSSQPAQAAAALTSSPVDSSPQSGSPSVFLSAESSPVSGSSEAKSAGETHSPGAST